MSIQQWIEPCELNGSSVKLIPLSHAHLTGLIKAEKDGDLSTLWFTSVPNALTAETYIAEALHQQLQGKSLPFVVIDNNSNEVIGSTRYCNIDSANKRVEIGYTWYGKSYQRSSANTQCKLLMLQYAFETLGVIAVEFRTHWHNQASRTAIARLGAKQDGVLRNHQQDPDGGYRDTVVFSIINSEWPIVKKSLNYKLQ
ncbi:MAG: GNAT family N-acetyltransferase [Aliivibrio sp.]|uniref:GNAT family N-acetyltransferase n=1 Tax=Aliivibrio sp. TaxID=1872443 RepID=UPI001A5F9563|nr:GNAT family N-acetyltransferase [Aliivibrio sp.]